MAELESVKFPYGYDRQEFTAPTTTATYIYSETKKSWIFSAAQALLNRNTSESVSKYEMKGRSWLHPE